MLSSQERERASRFLENFRAMIQPAQQVRKRKLRALKKHLGREVNDEDLDEALQIHEAEQKRQGDKRAAREAEREAQKQERIEDRGRRREIETLKLQMLQQQTGQQQPTVSAKVKRREDEPISAKVERSQTGESVDQQMQRYWLDDKPARTGSSQAAVTLTACACPTATSSCPGISASCGETSSTNRHSTCACAVVCCATAISGNDRQKEAHHRRSDLTVSISRRTATKVEYRREYAFAEDAETKMIVTASYKYMASPSQPLLFELHADPDELHNLAGKLPDVETQLQRRLDEWLASTGPVVPPNPLRQFQRRGRD